MGTRLRVILRLVTKTRQTVLQHTLEIRTRGRGTYDITDEVQTRARESGIQAGLCHLFIQHTSASLIVCENADPSVRTDLERFMSDLVPDGDRRFVHTQEGPDDMPAHVRSVLTDCSLTLPVTNARCALGTWQGVYIYEHRSHAHTRRVTLTFQGS